VNFLRSGLILAALLGEAVQGGAMQTLGGRLNRAAIFSHGRAGDPKCGNNYCNRLHLHSPLWLMRVRPVRLFDDPRHMPCQHIQRLVLPAAPR